MNDNYNNSDRYRNYYNEEHLKRYEAGVRKNHPASSAGKELGFMILMFFGIIVCVGIPPLGALIIVGAYKIRES